jgi:pilus assembly protein Flp/PilA
MIVRYSDRRKGLNQMSALVRFLSWARRDDRGQGLAEYALILALIAIVAIVALIFLGGQISTILSSVGNSV